jgi:hypothetical protein
VVGVTALILAWLALLLSLASFVISVEHHWLAVNRTRRREERWRRERVAWETLAAQSLAHRDAAQDLSHGGQRVVVAMPQPSGRTERPPAPPRGTLRADSTPGTTDAAGANQGLQE